MLLNSTHFAEPEKRSSSKLSHLVVPSKGCRLNLLTVSLKVKKENTIRSISAGKCATVITDENSKSELN